MLFLVISTPRPEQSSTQAAARIQYWTWMNQLLANGQAKFAYPRVGRGVAAIFDVDSNDTLHRLLNEWSDIVPTHFEVFPLLEPAGAIAFLENQVKA